MEPNEVKILLEKYENATTTLAEEQVLRTYFKKNKDNEMSAIFNFYAHESKLDTKIKDPKIAKIKPFNWKIPAIAASFVIGMIIATFIMGENKQLNSNDLGTITNPDEAYLETIKALELVSVELNKGIEKTKYLNEFDKTKNLIFKK